MPYTQADSLGCPPFVLFGFFCYIGYARQSEGSNVAEIDVDLLRWGLAVLFFALVNNDFADECSQYLRRQFLYMNIFPDNIKEFLHIGTLAFECINFFL